MKPYSVAQCVTTIIIFILSIYKAIHLPSESADLYSTSGIMSVVAGAKSRVIVLSNNREGLK